MSSTCDVRIFEAEINEFNDVIKRIINKFLNQCCSKCENVNACSNGTKMREALTLLLSNTILKLLTNKEDRVIAIALTFALSHAQEHVIEVLAHELEKRYETDAHYV